MICTEERTAEDWVLKADKVEHEFIGYRYKVRIYSIFTLLRVIDNRKLDAAKSLKIRKIKNSIILDTYWNVPYSFLFYLMNFLHPVFACPSLVENDTYSSV